MLALKQAVLLHEFAVISVLKNKADGRQQVITVLILDIPAA